MRDMQKLYDYILETQPDTASDVLKIIDNIIKTGIIPIVKVHYAEILTAKEAGEIMVKGFKEYKRNA